MTLDEDVLFDQGDGLGPLASLKKSIEAGWLGQVHRHLSNLPEVIDAGLLTPGAGRRSNWRAKWADRAQELMADPHYPYRVEKICWAPLRGDQGPTCGREEWLARNSSVAGSQSELAEVTDENLRFMDRPGIPKLVVVYLETPVVRGDAKKNSYTVTFVPPNSDTELKIECAVKTDLVNMFVMPLSARVPTKKRLDADRNASTLTGGVSVVMVQNWDLAIVWKQLERDPIFADAYKALRLDADRDKALWPKSRIDGGFRQGVSDGERALIVEMFDVLRQAGCAVLKCDDILGFMDKNELDKLRAAVKDTSAAPVFADFEEALRELDKVGFFRESSKQHAANEAKVEECARRLLADDHLELSANDVSMMVSDADMDDIEDLCQARSPELYLKAQMLRLALRQFDRKKFLMAMSQAGLIVFTTKCREDFSDGIPRLVTMITAPNDRMEYEAEFNEDFKIRKRVRSIHEALERGPRIPFRCERPDEPYPYTPYFEPPKLATGTNDCVFTHEERQTLIRSIIQAPNNRCTDQDDGSAFPSNSGAAIDLDEAIGEEQCELYFPLHHTEAVEILQVTWAMNVPQRLGIADTVKQNTAISTTMPPPLLTLLPDILHATQPLDQIRDYFGSSLAWYFAWMGFYTDALSFPTLVGLVVWGASLLGYTQEELPTHALYSVFISVWATIYLQLWTRQQAEQAYDWGFSTSGADAAESLGVSQEFIKKMRSQYLSDDVRQSEQALGHLKAVLKGVDLDTIRNDVVDYGLWYFPQQSRSRRQLVTGFVTFLCCVCVMSMSQILFIFEDISEDLGVNRQTVYTIKGVTAGMLIPSLKFGYHRLAKRMADWETHATASQRADSIALKEFVFGYFNSYISLLWIAFFRSDAKYVATDDMTSEELRMQQLKTELFTVMVTAQFLNLAKEVLVPWFQNKRKATKDENKHTTTGRHTPYMNLVIAEAVREMRCPRPQSNTDEYLKMVCAHHPQPHQLCKYS